MRAVIYIALKIIVITVGLYVMYLSANFWIGSQEDWQEAVNTRFWEFSVSRLGVTFLVGLFFVLISLLVNRVYWWKEKRDKPKIKRSILGEITFAFIAAIILVAITVN